MAFLWCVNWHWYTPKRRMIIYTMPRYYSWFYNITVWVVEMPLIVSRRPSFLCTVTYVLFQIRWKSGHGNGQEISGWLKEINILQATITNIITHRGRIINQRTVSTAKRLASLFWYLIASTIDTLHKTINGYEIACIWNSKYNVHVCVIQTSADFIFQKLIFLGFLVDFN